MTQLNGSPNSAVTGVNGDPAALSVDRAIAELRRGRCVEISDGERALIVAAIETTRPALVDRLLQESEQTALLLTAERAQAAGLNDNTLGAVAVSIETAEDLEICRSYAGMSENAAKLDATLQVSAWSGSSRLAAAAFRLAKVGRLMPALIGFEASSLNDESVICVALVDVEQHAGKVHANLTQTSRSRVPLADAEDSSIALFRDEHGGGEHVAVVIGQPDANAAVPVRLHSACLTGDVLGSLRCDCGEQLRTAVQRISELGGGVLLYLDQEGRGIGLANKLRAYSIQDTGLDTHDADRHLGFRADERAYDVAAALLRALGFARVRVMTNNPQKISALREQGIDVVGRLPLVATSNSHNERYLRAKRERAGHLVEDIGS